MFSGFKSLGEPAAAPAPAPAPAPAASGFNFFGAAAPAPAPAPAPAAASWFGAAAPAPASGSAKAPTVASITSAVTGVDPEQAAWEAQCSLTRSQRMMGFGVCFGLGMLISFLSTFSILKPVSFALLYSLGNIVAFMSSGFLVGPRAQCRMACDKSRAVATTLFLSSMFATLLTALLMKPEGSGKVALVILLIIVQFCSLVWYSASYIPFAQNIICSTCKAALGRATGAAAGG